MHNRRRILFVCLAAAVTIIPLLRLLWRDREPLYEGRPLSWWVLRYHNHAPGQQDYEAAKAICSLGHVGLPYLIKWIDYEPPPPWVEKFTEGSRVIPSLERALIEHQKVRFDKCTAASSALRELAPRIKQEAIAPLIRIISNSARPRAAVFATQALPELGQPGLEALMAALKNRIPEVRQEAARGIYHLGTGAAAALPTLIVNLNDTNETVAGYALAAICEHNLKSPAAFEALIRCLEHTNARWRYDALEQIQHYDEPKAAVLSILPLLHDTNARVRLEATQALRWIAPEALGRGFPNSPK